MKITLRAPIKIFTTEQSPEINNMLSNFIIERDVDLPFTFIPTQLDLIVGQYPVLFFVKESRFEEKTNRLIVFTEELEWHDKSFEQVITSVRKGDNGWREFKCSFVY